MVMLGRNGVAIPEPRSETEAWLGRALALPHGGGLGMFRVEDKTTGAPSSGVRAFWLAADTDENAITYAVRSDHWGVGLGREVGRALWEARSEVGTDDRGG